MDILEAITEDHEEIRALLDKMMPGSNNMRTEAEHFARLRTMVQSHSLAEEEVFYPLLLEAEDAREHMLEALEEHHITSVLLNELQDTLNNPDRERWMAKLSVFRTILEYHMDEEEGETFDYAQDLLSEAQLDELGDTFRRQKQSLERSIGGRAAA